MDDLLHRLRLIFLFVSLGGIVLAGALGLVIARTALGPVRRLTEAAERIAETRDLGERVEAAGSDELARLGRSFNTMLGALDESLRAQRQLVADASHELRTPLTSLRTNVELLARGGLPPAEQRRALGDAQVQIAELSALVADVVELAREGEPEPVLEDVRLDLLVGAEVRRASAAASRSPFTSRLGEVVVRGDADRLQRAVANILDNAVKWSPPGAVVEVDVGPQGVIVRDHGPGIAPEDLPFVFDRFYRAPAARGHARIRARARHRPSGRRAARGDGHRGSGGGRRHARAPAAVADLVACVSSQVLLREVCFHGVRTIRPEKGFAHEPALAIRAHRRRRSARPRGRRCGVRDLAGGWLRLVRARLGIGRARLRRHRVR